MLSIMGFPLYKQMGEAEEALPLEHDKLLRDLAGNAFCSNALAALLLGIFAVAPISSAVALARGSRERAEDCCLCPDCLALSFVLGVRKQ